MSDFHIQVADKSYPDKNHPGRVHQAIANLKLTIEDHEFVCLVGPSGCGKTTLLNIIAGLDTDFDGQIRLSAKQSAKIGYVFQNPRLLPWRTVRENIELACPEKTDTGVLDELLDIMELSRVQQSYPQQLSLGMSRRVAILRAFAIQPDLLLMDEPFVSLDAPTARRVRELLMKLWRQRAHTVLFVTHDLREAIALADRIVFLSRPPMQVVGEVKISLTAEQRLQEGEVDSFRQQLLQQHPVIAQLL
jgi:NitT/TauT family transport system ATP-binding protein